MTADLLESRRDVAQLVDCALGTHPNVSSVLVFGSVAAREIDEQSDVDMLIICRPGVLSLADRRRILRELGPKWVFQDPSNENRLFAEVDADGVVNGIPVSIHYQTASWISDVFNQVVDEGAVTTEKLPFRPYTLPALIRRAWVLRDKDGIVGNWQNRARVFPETLKRNIVRQFTPLLQESVWELTASAERGLGPRLFIFWLDRAVDALISLLLAVNETYDPAERRTERTILPRLDRVPPEFLSTLTDVLVGPFDREGARLRARKFAQLASQVIDLTETP